MQTAIRKQDAEASIPCKLHNKLQGVLFMCVLFT